MLYKKINVNMNFIQNKPTMFYGSKEQLDALDKALKEYLSICNNCRYVDGDRCNHPHGCDGEYEFFEPLNK